MTNEEFGKLIKDLRKKNNMTQKDLGEKLHITDKAISKWERGISFPDLEMINSIAEVFGIPVSNLIDTETSDKIKNTESNNSKNLNKFFPIIFLGFIIVILIVVLIININKNIEITQGDLSEVIVGTDIASPDRIIYKDSQGNYYEFLSGTEKYSNIKGLLQKSIITYTDSGEYLTDEEIDSIHENTSFIEFDYDTISKNYIIQLSNNNNKAVIRLADSGGRVCSKEILNLNKVKATLSAITLNEPSYKLDYSEYISKNYLDDLELDYSLKQIDSNIYQIKIKSLEDYEYFSNLYNIQIDYKITENTFENNDIILTLSMDYNISVKVNIGNIKYSYTAINSKDSKFMSHILIVSKIVNTDCIYNTILDESKYTYSTLDKTIFVTDFDDFLKKYNLASSLITEEKAREIAYNGIEVGYISMIYDSTSIYVKEETIEPNNYFSKKPSDALESYPEKIEVYSVYYEDDIGNGIAIYVDKKLGMIVGAKLYGI